MLLPGAGTAGAARVVDPAGEPVPIDPQLDDGEPQVAAGVVERGDGAADARVARATSPATRPAASVTSASTSSEEVIGRSR